MHQQRFAAAGGAPVRKLVELRPRFRMFVKRRNLLSLRPIRIGDRKLCI